MTTTARPQTGLVVLLVALGGLTACDDKSDFADSVAGPGVEVHCAALTPANRPAVGDTDVVVDCGARTP